MLSPTVKTLKYVHKMIPFEGTNTMRNRDYTCSLYSYKIIKTLIFTGWVSIKIY